MTAVRIEHCKRAFEFFMKLDGAKAVLQYRVLPNKVIDLHHTEVPIEGRGKGIAKLLCKEAFKYAKNEKLRILPTCSYVEKFVKEMATEDERELVVSPREL